MIDLLRTRRSIRKFTCEPIAPEQRILLEEALLRAPTSRGINPTAFVMVDDKALLKDLARAKQSGGAFLADAPLGIVICADPSLSDVWVEDCSLTAIILHLTAHSLGLGSCWIQIRKRMHTPEITAEARIRELLGIPDRLAV